MRHVLAVLLVVATLPYLTLKILWLTGSTVGLLDPALAHDLAAANAVTAGLDLVVVALAVVLGGARRVPAWTLVGPVWIGAGLLVPTVALLALAARSGGQQDFLAPWVRPLVYGGFVAQAVLLAALFGRYARRRWAAALAPDPTPVPLARTLARGSATVLLAVGVARIVGLQPFDAVLGLLALAGGLGALAVTERGRGGVAVLAAWLGTGAATGWGLYGVVLQLAHVSLAAGASPLDGLRDLASLLAGGVTGLAVLIVLAERVAHSVRDHQDVKHDPQTVDHA